MVTSPHFHTSKIHIAYTKTYGNFKLAVVTKNFIGFFHRTLPHSLIQTVGRVHGVSGEVCWGVGGGERSCGKRSGERCREVCRCVGISKERCVGRGVEKCVGVRGGMWAKEWGRCREVC